MKFGVWTHVEVLLLPFFVRALRDDDNVARQVPCEDDLASKAELYKKMWNMSDNTCVGVTLYFPANSTITGSLRTISVPRTRSDQAVGFSEVHTAWGVGDNRDVALLAEFQKVVLREIWVHPT